MHTMSLADLGPSDRTLLGAALAVRERAYAPYSRFFVGAAVRTADHRIHVGANLENASYGLSLCAEAAALAAANSAGDFLVTAIAVAGPAGEGPDDGTARFTTPCGRCRQLIHEAAAASGNDVRVLVADSQMRSVLTLRISELLPYAFTMP